MFSQCLTIESNWTFPVLSELGLQKSQPPSIATCPCKVIGGLAPISSSHCAKGGVKPEQIACPSLSNKTHGAENQHEHSTSRTSFFLQSNRRYQHHHCANIGLLHQSNFFITLFRYCLYWQRLTSAFWMLGVTQIAFSFYSQIVS